jgi:AcrR family transcriptional regulator
MNPDSKFRGAVRLRDRLRTETQAAILAAAEEAFATEGIERAHMESIAARAGVAVGTLYNYFEDRDGLLTALVEARRAALLLRLDTALSAGEGKPFQEALAAFLHAFFDHWAAHRGLLSVLFQADGAVQAARGRGSILDEVTRRAESVLRRGRAQGKVQADASGLQAALLVGMVRGVLRKDSSREGGAVPGDRAGQVLAVFLRGAGR